MIHLSERQLELLNSCLYGIKHLNDVQINALSPLEKKIIERRYFKTQKVLNRLKQKEVNKRCKYFAKVFYNSPVKKLFDSNLLSNSYCNKMKFSELYISKKMIIDELIEKDILPKNFYNLK